MPTYTFRCDDHGDWEAWRSIHASDPARCPHCELPGRQVFTPPLISVNATPNKGHDARRIEAMEQRWHKDMPAYKRLRKNGTQPKGIDGSAEMEQRAESRLEIEMGKSIPADKQNMAAEVNEQLRENAHNKSFDPSTLRPAMKQAVGG